MAGPYGTPRTWVAGERPTAAQFNEEIRDWVAALANPPACRVNHNTTQSINDNTETALVFNSERYDTDSMHSTSSNTSRITFNTAGLYVVGGTAALVNGSADWVRVSLGIRLNGTTSLGFQTVSDQNGSSHNPHISNVTTYKFAVNDYVELTMLHDNTSNAARNVVSAGNSSPEFWATWIGLG